MKKVLLTISVVIVLIVVVILFFLRSSSGFRSVYLVPDNAVLLVESKDPLKAWDEIVHSDAWVHLSSNPLLQELNSEIISFDSLVSSSKLLMKLVGKKPVLVSQHPIGSNNYELLYIVELGKVGSYKKPEKLFRTFLNTYEFEITSRQYNQHTIVEILDIIRGRYYFLSFLEGKLIFSLDTKIVEASIDAAEKMIVGRESKFLEVYSKLGNSGLISLYINHSNLGPFINSFSSETSSKFAKMKEFLYSGISFNITQEGLISFEAYSSLADTMEFSYRDIFHNGSLELQTSEVIPLRLASLAKVNFNDAGSYFHSSMQLLGKEDYTDYLEELRKIEKKFKINMEDNFFSWMDEEIVLLQTKPSNLGRSNEFAAILHADDSSDAADNLSFLWRQIKRNSPVKIRSVNYKGFKIDYVAFPGFLKLLFGELLDKIEKPYFSQIGDNVIISNHPQTIKNLIDDYLSGTTLNTSIEYYNFNKHFSNKSAMFAYFEPPVLYYNMKAFLSPDSWKNLQKNKEYFTCFDKAGMQIELSDDLIHFSVKAQYKPEIDDWKKEHYNPYEIISLFNTSTLVDKKEEAVSVSQTDTIPKLIIHQLDAEKQLDYFDNGEVKREMELKNGSLHGSFKEYHSNGELRIKGNFEKGQPSGKWKYFDEEGKLIKTDRY